MKSVLRFLASTSAVLLLCFATAITSPAQTFTTLFTFDGGNDGSLPNLSLVQGLDGNLYGMTDSGGSNCSPYGCGTVFKISSDGALTTIYNFCAGYPNCTDGSLPIGALLLATDGNFYGTTESGGNNCMPGYTCGTVFKITPTGTLTTLHTFSGSDGAFPYGALVQGTDGNLYGTTSGGGNTSNGCSYTGCGAVFKITTQGAFTLLHSFDSTDGASPSDGLIQARNGNFYATASGGTHGGGTVFEMTPEGNLTTLYNFPSSSLGADPFGGLVQAANGKFYGTTFRGGSSGDGTVFEITPGGHQTTLFVFCTDNNCADGAWPEAGLVQATDGNFYGTTTQGGLGFGDGTVFQITPEGTLTTLHAFDSTDGYIPFGLVQATNGNLYGMTYGGGNGSCYPDGCGTIFRLSMGLGPFVETVPTVGKVGSKVTILGNRLTGAASVTFNGADATFTIVSPTEIKTYVPTVATSGKVEVTLPSGTLTSNVVFRVK